MESELKDILQQELDFKNEQIAKCVTREKEEAQGDATYTAALVVLLAVFYFIFYS